MFQRYELMELEPSNGHVLIQLEKYVINIRILRCGRIKYCSSHGENNIKNYRTFGFE